MSANNYTLVYPIKNKWYIWFGLNAEEAIENPSLSPDNADRVFSEESEAITYAVKNDNSEYGISTEPYKPKDEFKEIFAQKVIDSKDVVSVEEIDRKMYAYLMKNFEKTNIAWHDFRRSLAQSLHNYITPIITKIQQEKEELSNVAKSAVQLTENQMYRIVELQASIDSASNELPEVKAFLGDYQEIHSFEGGKVEGSDQYRKLAIPIFAKLLKRIEKLESNLEYPTKEIEELRKKISELEIRLRRRKV